MADIYLYGDIWRDDASLFVSEMVMAGDRDVTICINSDGGDVFEAAAMFSAINRHRGKVTCRVDGIAASAAAYLCMAADEVVMAEGSFMMIHLPWSVVIGNRNDLDMMRRDLLVIEDAMVAAHAAKSGKSPEEIRSLFEKETLMGAQTAVDEGFADRVESVPNAENMDEEAAKARAKGGAERVMAHMTGQDQIDLAKRNIAAAKAQAVTVPEIHIHNHLSPQASAEEAPPPEAEPPQNQPPESAEIESEESATEPASSFVEPDIVKETPMSADLNALRAQRGDKAGAIRALIFDDDDNVKVLDEKTKNAINGMKKELAELEERIAFAEEAEERVKALAVPVVEAAATPKFHAQAKEPESKVAQFGQYLQCFAKGKGVHSEMMRIAASRFGERSPIVAVLNTTDDASIVPDPYANEIIELLRAESIVMAAGPRMVDLPNGKLTIPAGATGATASYTGEATNIAASEPTFRQVVLDAKKLTSLVPISNEIKNDSVANLEAWVREDIVASMGTTADINLLRADGSGNLPTGLRNLAQGAAVIAANATVNLANITNDLGRLELVLMSNNVRGGNQVWFMDPRSAIFLRDLRDGNGNLAYPSMSNETPTLRGKRVWISSQIPSNLGAGTDESEIYLVAMNHVMLGETGGLEIAVSEEASYFDGSNLQSAFSQDLTLIRAITRHDIDIRQLFAVAVLSTVTWGA